MKRKIMLILLLFCTFACYALKVGDELPYSPLGYSVYSFNRSVLTKVVPTHNDEFYNVEITTVVGSSYTITTTFILQLQDRVTMYIDDSPITLIVRDIDRNMIELSTFSEILNEE